MTTSANRRYIPEIDQIRGLAALLVLFYHGLHLIGARLAHGAEFDPARHWITADNPLIAVIAEGHSGVGLFIVLSGFVLSLGTMGRQIDYGRFLLARVLRIYPLLLVFAAVSWHVQRMDLAGLLAMLLPLNLPGAMPGSFTAMFWAVDVEFQCYLVFPFLILFSHRGGTRFLVQVIAVAVMLRLLAVLAEGANPRDLSYWTVVGRIDQFCLGMIAARLGPLRAWLGRFPLASLAGTAALAVLALWGFNRAGGWPAAGIWKLLWPDLEGAVWAGFILAYLAAGRRLPALPARVLTGLGEISYPLYLAHFVVLGLVLRQQLFLQPTGIGHYDALATTALVALPVVLLVALLLHTTVEAPFLRLRPRYVGDPDAAPRPG